MGHSYRGNRSSNSELVSVSQTTCSLFPACPTLAPYPPLRQQLLSHAHPFTPLLLLWYPQTLLGLLSIPEAMRSSGQRISQSESHPAPPVSPHHPLPRHIACLAFLHRAQEKKENLETQMLLRLRRSKGRSL